MELGDQMRRIYFISSTVLCGVLLIAAAVHQNTNKSIHPNKQPVSVPAKNGVKTTANLSTMSLYFISNRGQVNSAAKFYAKTSRYTLWLTESSLVFDSYMEKPGKDWKPGGVVSTARGNGFNRDVSRLRFVGANKKPLMVPFGETELNVNYFKGNDKSKWRSVPTSSGVLYKDLYKGIDLKVYGIEKEIEYDWIVKAGADPALITFHYEHVKATRIDKEGNLMVTTHFGDLIHKRPVSFQLIDNQKVPVDVTFKPLTENTFGLNVGSYDRNYPLIVDPVVLPYSTYLGGNNNDYSSGIGLDAFGYVYIAGYTLSSDFPEINAYMSSTAGVNTDIFVAKIDPTASGSNSLLYSTYLGGSDVDSSNDIVVDASGVVYIAGETDSTDFPVLNEFMTDPGDSFRDGVVTRLDTSQSGVSSLLYSSYIGGDFFDVLDGIALGPGDLVYLSGYSYSSDFPVLNAYNSANSGGGDAVVLQMDLTQSGASSLLYSTYIGGSSDETNVGLDIDAAGLVYAFGETESTDFPTVNEYMTDPGDGRNDFFIFKLDVSQGSSGLLFSTYLGGDNDEGSLLGDIVVDNSGNAYVVGASKSSDFPLVNQYMTEPGDGLSYDIVFAKLDTTGSGSSVLTYSTYIGGNGTETGKGIALDSDNIVYIAGNTLATDFPTLKEYMTDPGDSSTDATVLIMDPTRSGSDSLLFSTYLGGNSIDSSTDIAVDDSGNIYIVGYSKSTDYPTVNEYMTGLASGAFDTFVTHLQLTGPTLSTDAVSNIGANTSEAGGEVADAVFSITDRGFCWSTSTNPTTSDSTLAVGAGEGLFTGNLTGLAANTTYYVRTYAVNKLGTYYGNEVSFVTGSASIPTVTTDAAYNISTTTAQGGGNILSDGGAAVTARGLCWSTSPFPTTSDQTRAGGSGTGSFTATISGLTENTTYYIRAYATNSSGTAYGNQVSFSTSEAGVLATVTTDAVTDITENSAVCGGNVTSEGGSSFTISGLCWDTSPHPDLADSVKILSVGLGPFSTTITDLETDTTYYVRAFALNSNGTAYGDEVRFTPSAQGELTANRSLLYFGVNGNGVTTGAQTIFINATGNGTLDWSVSSANNSGWCGFTPNSGSSTGAVTVSVNGSGLTNGSYSDIIAIKYNDQVLSIPVKLTVYNTTEKPFGSFETPISGSTVMSSVPVTGWALDDIDVQSVKIYRSPVHGEGSGMIYLGDAAMVDGARQDVEQHYSTYPKAYQAGWGYMLLTNYLPNNGNGIFTLFAKATDMEGNEVILGSKTINCDNANAVKPFGAIDNPDQGGIASGSSYVNFGWALTPTPNAIPTDGSTITVWVDGVPLGNPVYNQYREDIAALFPGYNNSNGATGYFYLDTTTYSNGVHSIQWTVKDNAGNTDGIGSRFFIINNSGATRKAASISTTTGGHKIKPRAFDLSLLYHASTSKAPVTVKIGLAEIDTPGRVIQPDRDGVIDISIKQTERLELHLGQPESSPGDVFGYLLVGNQYKSLPVGSTLDRDKGVFYWHSCAGVYGNYQFVFIIKDINNKMSRTLVKVRISPKY